MFILNTTNTEQRCREESSKIWRQSHHWGWRLPLFATSMGLRDDQPPPLSLRFASWVFVLDPPLTLSPPLPFHTSSGAQEFTPILLLLILPFHANMLREETSLFSPCLLMVSISFFSKVLFLCFSNYANVMKKNYFFLFKFCFLFFGFGSFYASSLKFVCYAWILAWVIILGGKGIICLCHVEVLNEIRCLKR